MNINLHIENLILEGVDIPRSQRQKLQAVVEAELSRLITENGLAPSLLNGANVPSLPNKIQITNSSNPTQIGQQIAQSIYGGLNQ